MGDLILDNVHNLRSIILSIPGFSNFDILQLELFKTFVSNLLKTSNLYLEKLDLPADLKIPQLEYPNLSEFSFNVSTISLSDFKLKLTNIFNSFPHIKIINLKGFC